MSYNDHKEIGYGSVDWIHLAKDRGLFRVLVNTVNTVMVTVTVTQL